MADVAVLASGFVLRVLTGGVACGISVSAWMLLAVLSLSLFLAIGKRRGELVTQGADGRRVLQSYSVGFLERSMGTFEACGLVFYSLWSLDQLDGAALLSSPRSIALLAGVALVMLIFFRYSYVVEHGASDGDPVGVVLSDKPLISLIAVWVITMAFALYG